MRYRKMTAKYPGTCGACNLTIEPGDRIYWQRGAKPQHVDCETALLRHTWCTACGGHGYLGNGRRCRACDGTGDRDVQNQNRVIAKRREAERAERERASC